MPGMSSGVSSTNPIVVAAFHAALLHQSRIVLAIVALLAMSWNILRAVQLRRALASPAGLPARPFARVVDAQPEPAARRLLRIFFGCLWILDGLLQAQTQMPTGMTPQVIEPTARASQAWVQHVVNFGATLWTDHPIVAACSVVWIQVGIGAMLLVAPRGRWSRGAGLLSVGWGLAVWVFGESFGGVFASGASFLFGLPGAVLFYCVAGVLIALPESVFDTPALGRRLLRLSGVFLLGMALLEAWPGRGFWQGQPQGAATPGQITAMTQQMSQTPQPALLSSTVAHFGSFDAAHGWAVNLFATLVLGGLGVALVVFAGTAAGHRRRIQMTIAVLTVFCLADWVLVQDLGFLGGTGTDPNSMLPFVALILAGYLALSPNGISVETAGPHLRGRPLAEWREALLGKPSYLLRTIAAIGMVGVFLVGAAPMAFASVSGTADAVLWQALNGPPQILNEAAPQFTLVDQSGRTVSLSSLRGKVVGLTFLDPVCNVDCPLIAQEFRVADQLLGGASAGVEMVAVVANPLYRSQAVTRAFDHSEGLDKIHNWLFLTGPITQLNKVWAKYGVDVQVAPAGSMVLHNDLAYLIDAAGRLRVELGTDPGPATAAYKSSFAGVLAAQLRQLINSPAR